MINRYSLSFLLSFLFLLKTAAIAQAPDFLDKDVHYVWPTDASTYLSSTFGETRSAHFHAGLDIKTWGQEGFRVFATREGIVYRIGITPTGYGKVIYLKHDDGSFSVYAHLNRFEKELQSVADSIRLQDRISDLDHFIEHKNIRFNAGDVIAYTGSTGIGPPHLHFELRTPEFEPFNPLYTNLKVPDTIPPVFSGLAIEEYDLEDGSLTNILTRNPVRRGTHYNFGTVQTEGPFGIAVDVYDRKDRTYNAYAVYELLLIADTDTLYRSRANQFSYKEASQMFIDRSYPLLFGKRKGYQRLYRVNGNELNFHTHNDDKGILYLDKGVHDITIIAKDFSGN
ncbi:MAG: M23 family metallopeptidase, partial [Balneolaceae bacterium]